MYMEYRRSIDETPRIGVIEAIDSINPDANRQDSDAKLLRRLKQRLRKRKQSSGQSKNYSAENDFGDAITGQNTGAIASLFTDGDHYEPQRLTRKIVWQYNQDAKKVPMFRRSYIA